MGSIVLKIEDSNGIGSKLLLVSEALPRASYASGHEQMKSDGFVQLLSGTAGIYRSHGRTGIQNYDG